MTTQPDPDPQHHTLVQREGVNAGSDRSTGEGAAELAAEHAMASRVGAPVHVPERLDEPADDALAPASDVDDPGQDDGAIS